MSFQVTVNGFEQDEVGDWVAPRFVQSRYEGLKFV